MVFLKTLTAEYLRLCGYEISCEDGVIDINEAPSEGETANDFIKAEINNKPPASKKEKTSGFMDERACPMSGRLAYHRPCQVIHFELDSYALKKTAKDKGATVTEYNACLMFIAGKICDGGYEGKIQNTGSG
jgi:hypothetical protein